MKQLLMGKASGITKAIDAMSPDQRQILPSVAFGEDYNRLRDATVQAFPELEALMPPTVLRHAHFEGSNSSFAELRTYSEQIFQMLGALDD